MFSDYTSEINGFPSVTLSKRDAFTKDSQTPIRESQDSGIQSKTLQSSECQTVDPSTARENVAYDEESVAKFLRKVTPLLFEELEFSVDMDDDENSGGETLEATKVATYEPPPNLSMKVSSISWNCTGGTLATAYACLRHNTWCNHEGQIVVYTTDLNRPTIPKVLHNESCVTSISFHPWEPSILVAGLNNGEIKVWDLRKEEDTAAQENVAEHKGQVVCVGWISGPTGTTCFSAGADGRIITRKISFPTRNISINQKFLITRSSKASSLEESLQVTALSQITNDSSIVAAGSGQLVHTSFSSLKPILSQPEYMDPVVVEYQPHRTLVTAIRYSKEGNKFASVSIDGEVRVYKIMEIEPKYTLHMKGCPLDIFWTINSTTLAVAGLGSKMEFIRPSSGQILELNNMAGRDVTTTIEGNERRGTLAVGDEKGTVEIWRLKSAKDLIK